MKKQKATDFLTVVFFFGILLSILIYLSIGTLFIDPQNPSKELADHENGLQIYNDMLSHDNHVQSFIRQTNYKLFRHVDSTNVITGRNGFLFEMEDKKNHYNYLQDYVGAHGFTQEELAQIAQNLELRRTVYEAHGISYMVFVIPNSLSVCTNAIPDYLGEQSSETRLALLSDYLTQTDSKVQFHSLTAILRAQATGITPLYNNTENSINAIGAYYTYEAIMAQLPESIQENSTLLSKENINFSIRFTAGKKIASDIGMQDIIRNHTISLTDNLIQKYQLHSLISLYDLSITTANGASEADACPVLFEFSQEWDKLQLMPLFSNSFSSVAYKSGFDYHAYVLTRTRPSIVVQVLRENELGMLLDPVVNAQYRMEYEHIKE